MRRRRAEVTGPQQGTATLIPDLTTSVERPRLGDLLVETGAVTRASLEAVFENDPRTRLGTALVAVGLLDESAVVEALGEQLRVPVLDLRTIEPDPAATALVSEEVAHRLDVLPLAIDGDVLTVAVVDPLNGDLRSMLQTLAVAQVNVTLGVPSHIRNRVNQVYRATSAVQTDIDAFRSSDQFVDPAASLETITDDEAPIVQVVNKIVTQALRDRASDVHIEPTDDGVHVRFRVDGALHQVLSLPADMGPALVSRVKIMADMNIVERRRPQDGQFEMSIDGRDLDVRVSTTATIWGEKTVLRLLDRTRSLLRLGDLGMPPDTSELYSRIVASPFGMVIVTGPTGSGKTTTLYATLSEINRPDINVMTIEDPVEYVFPKVNQIQISDQAGLTFATGLKSILRQDPDVILVGEVRDVETARIAVQSALTGHLVLSSVHAIDSVSALYRLLDMGIESFRVTSAIVGVVAQRLVRRICASCTERYEPTDQELAVFRKLGGGEKRDWMRGVGCSLCSGTGYFERVGVYEVLPLSDDIRACLVDGSSPRVARELAITRGLRTLQSEAVRLVTADVTTIDEVVRHVFVSEGYE
jgi:type IV pilus assembly protein PilB